MNGNKNTMEIKPSEVNIFIYWKRVCEYEYLGKIKNYVQKHTVPTV